MYGNACMYVCVCVRYLKNEGKSVVVTDFEDHTVNTVEYVEGCHLPS